MLLDIAVHRAFFHGVPVLIPQLNACGGLVGQVKPPLAGDGSQQPRSAKKVEDMCLPDCLRQKLGGALAFDGCHAKCSYARQQFICRKAFPFGQGVDTLSVTHGCVSTGLKPA